MSTQVRKPRLDGKVALVVGAGASAHGTSNGSACAIRFAEEGAVVLCADKVEEAALLAVEQINRAGGRAHPLIVDVAVKESIDAMVAESIGTFGTIDILHNNVGIQNVCELADISIDSWDWVHAVNLRGPMLSIQAVVSHMKANGGGSIISMSSTAGKHWTPTEFLSYNTSKAALNHMTKVLARQLAPQNIRCNVIVAGLIDTPHAKRLAKDDLTDGQHMAARIARCPMGRQGDPRDIANAALFLASDESSYVTGLELVVDGGLTL